MGLIDNVNVNVGGNGNVIDTLSTYITKVLKPNIINDKNILSQDMMPIDTGVNTKYVIKYNYELSEDITVPANCVLEFDGGSISGAYTITGNNTGIEAGLMKIFDTDVTLGGTWNVAEVYPEWFGAKGDYNIDTHTGTDDSFAFTKSIKAANDINCNVVKLSSAIYYINNGITVSDGNIRLVGGYANIREDNKFNFKNNVKEILGCSFVTSPTCEKIINFDGTVSHPIIIQYINFYNLYTVNHNYTAKAIFFDSLFDGPTWPFIVEYCHFYGFDKAISFGSSSPNSYPIFSIRIRNNGFFRNNICIHLADKNNVPREFTRVYTLQFEVSDNCAHHNAGFLYAAISGGNCIIRNNNFEGTIPNNIDGTTSEYTRSIDLQIAVDAKIVITDNYSEFGKPYLKLDIKNWDTSGRRNGNTLTFKNNAARSEDPMYIEVVGSDYSDLVVYECDFTLRFLGGRTYLIIPNKMPDIEIVNGYVSIESLNCPLQEGGNSRESIGKPIIKSSIKRFGKTLYYKNNAGLLKYDSTHILGSDSDKKAIAMLIKIESNTISKFQSVFRFTDNYSDENTMYSYTWKGYPWRMIIFVKDDYIENSDYRCYVNKDYYATVPQYFVKDLTSNESLKLPNDFSLNIENQDNNHLSSIDLAIIENPIEGLEVYLDDLHKKAIYNGTSWVDATGTPV